MLKALAGTDWGQDQETDSKHLHGPPILAPLIKPSLWDSLQSLQNTDLRIAIGSYNMAAPNHLHRETKYLLLREHSIRISNQ